MKGLFLYVFAMNCQVLPGHVVTASLWSQAQIARPQHWLVETSADFSGHVCILEAEQRMCEEDPQGEL